MTQGTVVPQYVDLRFPDGKLAARYDPARNILEIRKGGTTIYFDLAILAIQPIEKSDDTCYNFDR
jgi:hypothetical protein